MKGIFRKFYGPKLEFTWEIYTNAPEQSIIIVIYNCVTSLEYQFQGNIYR